MAGDDKKNFSQVMAGDDKNCFLKSWLETIKMFSQVMAGDDKNCFLKSWLETIKTLFSVNVHKFASTKGLNERLHKTLKTTTKSQDGEYIKCESLHS